MNTKNKIVKMAKGCYITAKVLYFLAFAACLTFTALAIALSVTNAIATYTKAETALIFATLALYSFVCIGLLWNVKGIFKSIASERSPFNHGVNHYIKKTAVYVMVVSVIPALLGTTILRIIQPTTELTFPISLSGVIAGVVLLLIGIFFKYGNELQEKDDETL